MVYNQESWLVVSDIWTSRSRVSWPWPGGFYRQNPAEERTSHGGLGDI